MAVTKNLLKCDFGRGFREMRAPMSMKYVLCTLYTTCHKRLKYRLRKIVIIFSFQIKW